MCIYKLLCIYSTIQLNQSYPTPPNLFSTFAIFLFHRRNKERTPLQLIFLPFPFKFPVPTNWKATTNRKKKKIVTNSLRFSLTSQPHISPRFLKILRRQIMDVSVSSIFQAICSVIFHIFMTCLCSWWWCVGILL